VRTIPDSDLCVHSVVRAIALVPDCEYVRRHVVLPTPASASAALRAPTHSMPLSSLSVPDFISLSFPSSAVIPARAVPSSTGSVRDNDDLFESPSTSDDDDNDDDDDDDDDDDTSADAPEMGRVDMRSSSDASVATPPASPLISSTTTRTMPALPTLFVGRLLVHCDTAVASAVCVLCADVCRVMINIGVLTQAASTLQHIVITYADARADVVEGFVSLIADYDPNDTVGLVHMCVCTLRSRCEPSCHCCDIWWRCSSCGTRQLRASRFDCGL
jgi:hypothetical protein